MENICVDPDCAVAFEPGDLRASTSRGEVCVAHAPRFWRLPTDDGRWVTVEEWTGIGPKDMVVRLASLGAER